MTTKHGMGASMGRWQRGVTLIELMISITIGVVLLGAILAVFSATSSTGRQSEAATRMSEDAAVAMNYMTGYIRMAGFSLPVYNTKSTPATSGSVTIDFPDRNLMGSGIVGCDNGFSNPTVSTTLALTCVSATGTAAISVRFQGDSSNTSPDASGNPTDCLSQGVTIMTPSEAQGSPPAYKMVESRFYIKTGTNSGVPELYCGGNGGASGFVAQPIMQYVEDLEFTYGVAENSTSVVPTRYMTAAQVLSVSPTQIDGAWSRVVSVKICIVMRSEMPDQNAPASYVDCSGNVVASSRYLRRAFRSVVSLRNRSVIS